MLRTVIVLAFCAIVLAMPNPGIYAQGPDLPNPLPERDGDRSLLGPSPGASGSIFRESPGGQEGILGGRPGPSVPRVPPSATRPGDPLPGAERRPGIEQPAHLSPMTLPLYGPLALPERDEEGPPDGLTLDAAIDRLYGENLDLRAKALELPKAQADILTAGLRANPILFADAQMIPYGSYSEQRPGGPTQYDVNITYPLDITGKRRARTVVAERAKSVLEAQYQDAVRVQIDNLYTAYVDVLAAREAIRFTESSIEGLRRLVETTEALYRQQERTWADVGQIQVQLDAAEIERIEAEEALRDAKRSLAVLLNIPPHEAGAIALRGSLRQPAPITPTVEELVRIALAERPDIAAFRLGIHRAEAEVDLAEANRMSDVFLLVQPYTFEDNSPYGAKSAHSWAVGVTIPLPLFDRNQGNIQRARITASQTRVQLADIERRVVAEVEQAARQYEVTRAAVLRLEQAILPSATQIREAATLRFTEGEADAFELLNAQRGYNDVVRQYRDTLIRHRRSMLRLNTTTGRRILP